jgi:hypothetical protein
MTNTIRFFITGLLGIAVSAAMFGCADAGTSNADDMKAAEKNQPASNNPDVPPSDASNTEFGPGKGPKGGG